MRRFLAAAVFFAFLGLTLGLSSGCGKDEPGSQPKFKTADDPNRIPVKKIGAGASGGGETKKGLAPVVIE